MSKSFNQQNLNSRKTFLNSSKISTENFNEESKNGAKIEVIISQNELWEFFSIYDSLTPLQKKIFQYMQWFAINKPSNFVCQFTVSNKLKCSREYVNKILKRFQLYGWITWMPRGKRRSNLYFMPPKIACIQVHKKEQLMKQLFTFKFTPSYLSTKKSKTSYEEPKTGKLDPPLRKEKKPPDRILPISSHVKNLDLPFEVKLKCSLVPENYYALAVESMNWRQENGGVANIANYIGGAVIKRAKKNGLELNWAAYYETLRYETSKHI